MLEWILIRLSISIVHSLWIISYLTKKKKKIHPGQVVFSHCQKHSKWFIAWRNNSAWLIQCGKRYQYNSNINIHISASPILGTKLWFDKIILFEICFKLWNLFSRYWSASSQVIFSLSLSRIITIKGIFGWQTMEEKRTPFC